MAVSETFKLGAFVAILAAMTASAVAQPLMPIACQDAQAVEEAIAIARLHDRETLGFTRARTAAHPSCPATATHGGGSASNDGHTLEVTENDGIDWCRLTAFAACPRPLTH